MKSIFIIIIILGITAIYFIIASLLKDFEIERLNEQLKSATDKNNKDWQDFYERIEKKGYGEFYYEHEAGPNLAYCSIKRGFRLKEHKDVIKQVLDNRKQSQIAN